MNKRLISAFALLTGSAILLFLLATASGNEGADKPSDPYLTFNDSLGNEVVLEEKPERVAVLFSSLCQVWHNAGGQTCVTVGESAERGICSQDVPVVDSGAGKVINNELLVSYEPDFVIYSSDVPAQRQSGELLKKAGIPSAAVRLDSFEDYLRALELFCSITGDKDGYDKYGKSISEEITAIKEKAAKEAEKERPRILFLRSGSSQSSCKAKKAEDNFAAKMLEELGCINIADKAPVLLDGLSAEEVLVNNPDYIFVSVMGDEEAGRKYVESVFLSDAYKTLDSKIVFLEKQLYQYKPCEKWNLAYKGLARVLYPTRTEE